MKITHNVLRIISCVFLLLASTGCGTQWAIRKDWEKRATQTLRKNQPASKVPLYTTVEAMECKNDRSPLRKFILANPGNTYHGAKEVMAWYCSVENKYWIFYQKGIGGGLHIQWFGPFDVPRKTQRTEHREQKTENKRQKPDEKTCLKSKSSSLKTSQT